MAGDGRDSRPASPLDKRIGERVAARMREANVTQTQLGAAIGTDQGSTSRRIRGLIAWKASDVEVAAQLLGVSVAYLMSGDEPAADQAASA
jgi:transcriptional regulator with XRE-family HTH domain